jgi:hypothetical protein
MERAPIQLAADIHFLTGDSRLVPFAVDGERYINVCFKY